MDLIPNPEYEAAELEASVLDAAGNRMSEMTVCRLYGRIRPPRYKRNSDGSFAEVLPFLTGKMWCKTHNREAIFNDGEWKCDKRLGGIMFPCQVELTPPSSGSADS